MTQQEGFDRETTSVLKVVDKLINVSKVIEHRMGLKPAEKNRVNEAFTLLAKGPPPANSTGAKQRVFYLDFLQRVQKVAGLSKVVLCAVGLGSSAVASMRDRVRVDLPFAMKEQEDAFESGVLQSLTDTYSAQFFAHENCSNASETHTPELIDQPPSTNPGAQQTEGQAQGQTQVPAIVSLTGDVYQLTIEDIRTVATSNEIAGEIWLTDTYGANTTSFITIPISNKLTDQFMIQRPRVM